MHETAAAGRNRSSGGGNCRHAGPVGIFGPLKIEGRAHPARDPRGAAAARAQPNKAPGAHDVGTRRPLQTCSFLSPSHTKPVKMQSAFAGNARALQGKKVAIRGSVRTLLTNMNMLRCAAVPTRAQTRPRGNAAASGVAMGQSEQDASRTARLRAAHARNPFL